jgi:hypothetical protein
MPQSAKLKQGDRIDVLVNPSDMIAVPPAA